MAESLSAFERPRIGNSNTIFKSGHLLISSKGLGWKSWRKRWFILTRTSLVFFKNDPSAISQRGGEVNLTLGGIDLNNSGSVIVREDKKLLTVLFPDGRDGRAFTLKAETSGDLYEWKIALQNALAQAPNAALVMGHHGILRSDSNDEISFHQWRERKSVKSLVLGRPILLALEDIDGGPSFLEKALRFLEAHGINVEGILRQAADVEEVLRRVQEYEQGKTEFGADEDAHVIGDCVKHVLRELPSSPVPVSCCTALLEAYKIDQMEARVNAMGSIIQEAFPEPNRRLLQRLLKMMHTISSHAHENRMTASAVAACMAPLLLRPLLAGECELDDDYDMHGDGSAQLFAAANAANYAQAIVTTLLEEYENIFPGDSLHAFSTSAGSRNGHTASENTIEDKNPEIKINGYHDAQNGVDPGYEFECGRRESGEFSESSGSPPSDLYDYKASLNDDSDGGSPVKNDSSRTKSSEGLDLRIIDSNSPVHEHAEQMNVCENRIDTTVDVIGYESQVSIGELLSSVDQRLHQSTPRTEVPGEKVMPGFSNANVSSSKRSTFWGKKNPRNNPSMQPIDSSSEEELAIQRLETAKNELRHRIAKEARGNAILQASLERRKQALHERRLALEQDVARLQEQLQAERDLRAALEGGLSMSSGQFPGSRAMDSKTRAGLEEIAQAEADVARLKQKVAELHQQLNQQRQYHYSSLSDACGQYQIAENPSLHEKLLHLDYNTALAVCNHERKQRTEEFFGAESKTMKGHHIFTSVSSSSSSKLPPRKQSSDSSDTKSSSLTRDERFCVDSAPSTSRIVEGMEYPGSPSAASSTLVELTTRLDFFKERRSQLMEQLQNLDLNYGSIPHEFAYKPSSPSWS